MKNRRFFIKKSATLTLGGAVFAGLINTPGNVRADGSTTDPGTTDPGTTDPGTTDPGTTDPGTTDPETPPPTTTTWYEVWRVTKTFPTVAAATAYYQAWTGASPPKTVDQTIADLGGGGVKAGEQTCPIQGTTVNNPVTKVTALMDSPGGTVTITYTYLKVLRNWPTHDPVDDYNAGP